jgi:hypothetical protein
MTWPNATGEEFRIRYLWSAPSGANEHCERALERELTLG